jgi:TonB-dependent receptor
VSQSSNKFHPNTRHRLIAIAVAGACAAMVPAFAQENPQSPTTDVGQPQAAAPAQTVVVTGIRAAMQSTLNLKRNSDGIVDGIVADDIGKFPDTNLAEAVQRISGVSIDRTNGEGQRVTVRGIGPDFNLILLNGRQMPSANLDDRGSRSFDFSNLASEAISQIQVYKSARADTPAGGVGATLNIMTGRPLDLGNQTSVGGKIVYDQSNTNLPSQMKGKNITPEVSTLISRKFGTDDMFGLSLSASYQKRNAGNAMAQIPNGWNGPYQASTLATSGRLVGATGIVNAPSGDQIFQTPQNLSYILTGTQRQRTNGQLTFQFRPTKDWTTTLDYTYARNKVQTQSNALNMWFSAGPATNGSTWVNNGRLSSPSSYTETYDTPQDLDIVAQNYATVSTLKSTGFNTQYRVNSGLKLSLDAHHSVAESGSDSPYGSGNDLSLASFGRNANTVTFNQEMPVTSINYTPAPFQTSGSYFDDATVKQTIDQVQASGNLKIGESSNLNFGVGHIKTKFDSAFQRVEQDTWGGTSLDRAGAGKYYDQGNFTPVNLGHYFSKLGGSGDPALFPTMWVANFAGARQDTINFTSANNADVSHANYGAFSAATFTPSLSNPSEIRSLQEKSNSLYGQFNTDWDTAMPMHTGIGLRYEKTTVDTAFTIANPSQVNWIAQNEFQIVYAPGVLQNQSADYHFWLPTVDWDMDVTSNLKVRASYSTSIGRPRWDLIQGGTSWGAGNAQVEGLHGSTGNPALRPVKSQNLDLSAEWYYTKQSMVSAGLFYKKLGGYPGSAIINTASATAAGVVGGNYWNAATGAGGCGTQDLNCIRDYIFKNFNGQNGVSSTGIVGGHYQGTISGVAGDPGEKLILTTNANQNNANVKGAEINWQHMFDNGFGFQANYTYVKSGLKYDNYSTADAQFAMVGLSNSANLVGIYENAKTSVRLAYNWRGEFLNTTAQSGSANPSYTEPYGQVDLSIGYNVNKNLSVSLEAINLTNATQRMHGRDEMQVLQAVQFGPRYMIGARYKF